MDIELIPATLNRYVYHVSNPRFRAAIMEQGLLPIVGEQRCFEWEDNNSKVIFLTNATEVDHLFQSGYDDDVWRVDTKGLSCDKCFVDPNFRIDKHVVLYIDNIAPERLKLVYEGNPNNYEEDRTNVNIKWYNRCIKI